MFVSNVAILAQICEELSHAQAAFPKILSQKSKNELELPSLSFHDNRASYSWDTIWPWKFKFKGQDQRYLNQRSVQLTHFLSGGNGGGGGLNGPKTKGTPVTRCDLNITFGLSTCGMGMSVLLVPIHSVVWMFIFTTTPLKPRRGHSGLCALHKFKHRSRRQTY